MIETVLAGAAAAGLPLLIWWLRGGSRNADGPQSSFVLPSGVNIVPAPFLTEAEISLYNLIKMAARDHYLVFAQVPLWSFLSVEALGKVRSQMLTHIALKRVDFVLVHPGSRQVEQVVQIEDTFDSLHQMEFQRVIESVLDAAGIRLVKVQSKKSYTIPDLATILGFEAED